MKIGVLALQGSFQEHSKLLKTINIEVVEVRSPNQLAGLAGLIIPGGESTTIGKLMIDYNLLVPIREFGKNHAIWGTCAGAILLSKDAKRDQPLLNLMDISVERNAFGRQVDSFEADLSIDVLKKSNNNEIPFHAVFIRAPIIESVHGETKIIAKLPDGRIVAAQQNQLLATSFHPELTNDTRFHEYFISLIK